ncbi:MAG: class GN sortase [Gammaproteobacteria bacterium]
MGAVIAGLQALWIPAKAALGQALLERAWQRQLTGDGAARPWPWADTRPVAVLEIPRLGLRQLVLEGASGRNLAWGPAALTDIEARDLVISAHRDTHFRALEELQAGDELSLESTGGNRRFRVAWLDIVHGEKERLVLEPGRERLTLVTCWPFDATGAGGPLRLVATALPLDEDAPRSRQAASQAGAGNPLPRRNSGLNSLDW